MRRSIKLPLEQLAPYCLPDAPPGRAHPPFRWAALFGNDRPVEVEVGFGKGLFLLTASAAHPDTNYFGVEIVRKYQLLTATRLAEAGRANVRVAWGDAKLLLGQSAEPASVRAVRVYFPDPWWKKRHHKRRLFTDDFAALCARVLVPGGLLHFVTDVEAYHGVVAELMAGRADFACDEPPGPSDPRHDLDYLTHFERKFRMEGRPIYRAAWRTR